MDFALGETQQAVAAAAAPVLDRSHPPPAQAAPPAEDGRAPWDEALWKELAHAGLLGLAVPDWLGGDGLGVMDTAVLLTEVGRRAAPVPALATLAMSVLPVVRATTVRDGRVSGVKTGVQYGAAARWILVPASLAPGGTGVAVVDPSTDGVKLRPTPSSVGGPEYTLQLDEAPVAHLLGDDHAVTDLYRLTLAGAACLADGALAGALALTTAHVGSRKQFGRPLAAFQAVAQQIADVCIVSRTLHLAAVSACWRLETGREADGDLDVAAYWLADRAPGVLRTCHHLHGGTGMDVTYPLFRYSALVKDLVRLIGGADYRLDRLGARLCAGTGVTGG